MTGDEENKSVRDVTLIDGQTGKGRNKDSLTVGDWLAFLEARSSNYIASIALMISLIAIVAVVLFFAEGNIKDLSISESGILLVLLAATLIIIGLIDIATGTSMAVEALEAKKISDKIVKGELDTVERIKEAWEERTTGRMKWLIKKIKKTLNILND